MFYINNGQDKNNFSFLIIFGSFEAEEIFICSSSFQQILCIFYWFEADFGGMNANRSLQYSDVLILATTRTYAVDLITLGIFL